MNTFEISTKKCINIMFSMTTIPCINSTYFFYIPGIVNMILFSAIFSPLYLTNYYSYDSVLYGIDMFIAFIIYNVLLHKYKKFSNEKFFGYLNEIIIYNEANLDYIHFLQNDSDNNKIDYKISFGFYCLFMLYWLYDSTVKFVYINDKDILIQLGNCFMMIAWYFYFSIACFLYFFICIKLSYHTHYIIKFNEYLNEEKRKKETDEFLSINFFYIHYDINVRSIQKFNMDWNALILLGFVILIYHIPIDIVNVIYNYKYTDIIGIIMKTSALSWYTYQICWINNQTTNIISNLYKNRIFDSENISTVEKYLQYNEFSVNLYGFKIDGSSLIKFLFFFINLVIPTIYAIVSNNFLKI